MLHVPLTNLLLLAAKQEPYKKAYLFMKSIGRIFWEKVQQNGPAGRKKDKTERVIGLGRRTRGEIVKWNQMTALRFQTGGERDIRHPPSLFGGHVVDGHYDCLQQEDEPFCDHACPDSCTCHGLAYSCPHLSSCMLVNHGPSQQSSKEEYKPLKWGATARHYAPHTKTMLSMTKSVPRASRQSDYTKSSWPS